ncbi:colorectal mutant cancer protein isoform X2 [Teleopsis dalmanni]|uniref:colorectal mutant cancer protein isoform X2 n=1 Tax=Teleopsis dalmanni TaxID=139649 RepID=UPI0018CE1567|nr:colorectal mutant cancer protein isoform X2 [Teleopsis dalmanni]
MISESLIPRSLSCLCCSESQPRDPYLHGNDFRNSWEYTLIAQPHPIKPIKVENLTQTHLEKQVVELSQRLQQAEQQRSDVQRQFEECKNERDLCLRRLEVVSTAHECRITEMHCVIAELSKKLRAKQDSTILEEQEPEGSEISYQEGSIYNSELNLTNPDAECQTDPVDGGAISNHDLRFSGENAGSEFHEEVKLNDTVNKGQLEALQEEVLHLRAQIALLQSEIANTASVTQEVIEEDQSIEVYGEDVEANQSSCSMDRYYQNLKGEEFVQNCVVNNESEFVATFTHCELSTKKALPVPKMAERVKLRCATKCENFAITDSAKSELNNIDFVEHLVSDLKQSSVLKSFMESSEFENELQQLQRKIEHLKIRNTVLTLTLEECKEHCEHLYLLCGKYESNAIALQTALNCSDRAIEAYDVMLALLESRLGLIMDNSAGAEDSRKAVELVARHLLDRLESEKDLCENSLGPWQNTFSIPDKICTSWTQEDDNRLRYHVSKLKGRRSTVQNTIVNLESPFSDFEKFRVAVDSDECLKKQDKLGHIDLEMALLTQEVLNIREENIGLKVKVEEAIKERQVAIRKIEILQNALEHMQLQLKLATDSFKEQNNANRVSYSENEHSALVEQQLVEALGRESELKNRIQVLIASQKAFDEKFKELHNNKKELVKSNLNLTQLLEESIRKDRTRKLERRITEFN